MLLGLYTRDQNVLDLLDNQRRGPSGGLYFYSMVRSNALDANVIQQFFLLNENLFCAKNAHPVLLKMAQHPENRTKL